MRDALAGLSLVDVSGYVIISVIIGVLIAGVMVTLYLHARYAHIHLDLERNGRAGAAFESPVLNRIVAHAEEALSRHGGEINSQAIIDQNFQSELKWLLIGERFVKASTGLMIILGLVGTFYGLTLSIGKLVVLVSGDISETSEITDALTQGLTRALSGMSVAFSTSLFGILAAIVMTVLGVFANVGDRRTAVMVRIEAFVDNVLLGARRPAGAQPALGRTDDGVASATATQDLARLCDGFGRSVDQLQGVVGQFEAALVSFSTTTRDFREFNLHLKDNVQRMSLSFGELSETLKDHVRELSARGPKQ